MKFHASWRRFSSLSACGSPAHSQGMLGVGISDFQVDPKGAFVGTGRAARARRRRRRI